MSTARQRLGNGLAASGYGCGLIGASMAVYGAGDALWPGNRAVLPLLKGATLLLVLGAVVLLWPGDDWGGDHAPADPSPPEMPDNPDPDGFVTPQLEPEVRALRREAVST
jgi:hypothetical protein